LKFEEMFEAFQKIENNILTSKDKVIVDAREK
jgi:hypothetical protein